MRVSDSFAGTGTGSTKSTASEPQPRGWKPRWLEDREACVIVVGARPPVPKTIITRDRHSGRLVEVPLSPSEAPYLDEGDPGQTHVFRKGEPVLSDHPAVLDAPGAFVDIPKDRPAA